MKVDGIKILEGLAASGLRSIRYALEVEGTGRVDANDLDSDAVEAMKRNIQYNGPEAEQRMRPLQGDARVIMLQSPLVGIRPSFFVFLTVVYRCAAAATIDRHVIFMWCLSLHADLAICSMVHPQFLPAAFSWLAVR